jgi:hypothetical protein
MAPGTSDPTHPTLRLEDRLPHPIHNVLMQIMPNNTSIHRFVIVFIVVSSQLVILLSHLNHFDDT